MKFKTIKIMGDLMLLPKNRFDKTISKNILVVSTKKWSLNNVYLMYFDFDDEMFHFPSYSRKSEDIKLKPITEINKWTCLPKAPRLNKLIRS